jgi:hypothetical protein
VKRTVTVKHLFNTKNQPIITVASIEVDDAIASGLAICSKQDTFNGKLGRRIALGRAFKALKNKSSCGEIAREEATNRLAEVDMSPAYKCFYTNK